MSDDMCDGARHYWKADGRCFCGEIERCVICFTNNRRCTRRTLPGKSVCERHLATWDVIEKMNKATVEGMSTKKRKS